MRVLVALSVLALLVSIPLAWRVYEGRIGVVDTGALAISDPRTRAAVGAENGWMGVAYSGWEQQVAARPDDLDALRERIRCGLRIAAVAVQQQGIGELAAEETTRYLERRRELDPDGAFLQSILQDWVNVRLAFPTDSQNGFYTRTSVALFLAARGDPRGAAWLAEIPSHGPAWTQFFAYARMTHPAWPAVRPLAEVYLADNALAARVEAGYTLLLYHAIWGAGEDLVQRHLESLRRDFADAKRAVERGRSDPETIRAAGRALLAMAILAARGMPEERDLLKGLRRGDFAALVPTLEVALAWSGVRPLSSIDPRGQHFNAWTIDDQIPYFHAAAHHVALIDAMPDAQRVQRAEERGRALQILLDTFESHATRMRAIALDLIVGVDREKGRECIRRALEERSVLSVRASILSDSEDRVPDLLPALRSPEIDTPALAAVGMLDLGPEQILQRKEPPR